MKQLTKFFLFSLLLATAVASCKKDENQIILDSSSNPVLTASSTSAMVLDINNKTQTAVTFAWTNPDYRFNTGISSLDVAYTIQVDLTGSNFTSSTLQEVVIAKDLSKAFTVSELNTLLTKLGLAENVAKSVDFRIKATINGTSPVYSNVLKITITPYLDVVYPVPANLYITGSASPAGWQCGCGESAPAAQTFTKTSSTTFKLTVTLTAGQSYLLLPVYGSWSAKYGGLGGNNTNNVNGDDFKPNGSDLLAPSVTKAYTITVEFKTGKFTVQ